MDNDKKLFEGLLKADGINPAGATESERTAFAKMLDQRLKSKPSKPEAMFFRPDIWRIIMKSKITKFAAAAVVILAAFLTVNFFDKSIPTAYAIEQTLEAMQNLRTVHMRCRDWNNNEYEMWIQLDPKTGIPEYCRAYWPKQKTLDISTPKTSYQYYERSNLVQVNSGKLYNIGVAPAKIFEQLLQGSKKNDPNFKVQLYNEYDSDGKSLIVAISETTYDSWKIFIDPETKLPVRIYCLKLVNKMGAIFKDIDKIEFNVDLPKDIFKFDIPQGAKIIDFDHNNKILSDPQYGISTDGMTDQQAAEQIATTYWNALITLDKTTAQKMAPVSAQMEDGSLLAELVEVGKLYVEPGLGPGKLIPCKIRYKDNSLKMWKLIIKSRNIDGKSSCVIYGYYDSPTEIKY